MENSSVAFLTHSFFGGWRYSCDQWLVESMNMGIQDHGGPGVLRNIMPFPEDHANQYIMNFEVPLSKILFPKVESWIIIF